MYVEVPGLASGHTRDIFWKKLEKQVRWDDQSQLHHLLTSVFVARRLVKVLLPPVLNHCTDMQDLMLDCLSAKGC